MAELKASELKYGVPLKTSVGDLFLTVTQVETPTNDEYAPETSPLELNLAKLGLTVEAPAGLGKAALAEGLAPTAGEAASTTALPVAAWSTPLKKATTANEFKKVATLVYPTDVQIVEGKLVLRVYAENTTAKAAGNPPLIEPKDASKATQKLTSCVCTVFVLGK